METRITWADVSGLTMVIPVLLFAFLFYGALLSGNFWYTEDGVSRELRLKNPQVSEVIGINRNIFSRSVITVKENGIIRFYCLDTNILWVYRFSDC